MIFEFACLCYSGDNLDCVDQVAFNPLSNNSDSKACFLKDLLSYIFGIIALVSQAIDQVCETKDVVV
jgi:hypothetical protein